jgi:hypothetical protein
MLLSLDTLKTRRDIAKILFVYDILPGRVSSPPLLTEVGFRRFAFRRILRVGMNSFTLKIIVRIMAHLNL